MTAFAVDPEDSNVLYAVARSTLRMSRDQGLHWQDLARNIPGLASLFVDPASPRNRRTVYVVTGNYAGVWDGSNFTAVPPPPAARSMMLPSAFPPAAVSR